MWWLTQARSPLARQNVLLSSAPQASSGRGVPPPGSARPAGRSRASGAGRGAPRRRRDHAHDRVVGAGLDRPVVDEEQVGDPRQPLERVVVAVGDRLVGHVAAGHHQRQRRRRRAAGGAAASTGASRRARAPRAPPTRATGAPAPARGEHDRRARAPRAARARRRRARPALRRRDDGAISANGLSSRCLRARSAATARLVVGSAGEVVAADPLDARGSRPSRSAPRPRATASRRRRPRPARRRATSSVTDGPQHRAGVGLGVEAAVGRVLVLGAAGGAHGKAGHRGQRPVVGDAAHDREARPAVGAVDERVAVAAVGGVEQLAQAVRAHRACRA